MKKLIAFMTAAVATLTSAFAATPVAVWDGDLADNSVQGDYTMTARSDDASVVQFSNGKAVTTATNNKTSQGVIISCPAASGTQNTTIFFKYSGYSAQNGNHAFFSANWEAAEKDVVIYGNGAKNRMGIAYGTTSSAVGNQNTNSSDITIPTAGVMMVSMSIQEGDALGTQVAIAPLNENGMYGDFVQLHRRDNVRWTGPKVTVMRLGGTIASTSHYYRPSLTIEGVKIFNTGITVAEANEMELFNPVEVFDGSLPTADEAARFRESTWKGTVWLKNITSRNNGDGSHFMDPDTYGNANSIVRLTGFNGYLVKDNEIETTVELVDDGETLAYNQTDGTTTGPVIFKKVIGSGTLTSKASGGAAQKIVIKDATGFTGSITMQGGRGLTIGDTSSAANNQIVVASGKTATLASGKTWTAAGGIKIEGTLTKEYGATVASGTTLSGEGEVIALGDSSAERSLNQIGLSGLTAAAWTGTLTIKNWRGQTDAGNAKFGNQYGNSASTIRFDGYDGYIFMQDYSAVKAYDIAEGGLKIRGSYTNGNAGFVGALTGSGPITVYANGSQNATAGNIKFIGDVTGYTGTISFDNGTAFRVAFLESASSTVPAYAAKEVLIGSGVTAPAFKTTGALHAMNGAILNPSTAISAAGSAIIDNGAVVQLDTIPVEDVKIVELENAIPMALPVQATIKVGDRVQTFYGLAQKTDGVYVVEQEELTWKGESGMAITAEGAWDAGFGGYAENAEYGKFVLPAGKTGVIKVPNGTANVGLMMVKGGSYIFEGEGQAWQIGALLVSEGAAVTFKNIDVDILSSDVSDPTTLAQEGAHIVFPWSTVSLASGEMTVNRQVTLKLPYTPSFNAAATIKIANAETLTPGVYKLMSWEKADAYGNGYGLPQLDMTGYTPETNAKVRLVPEVKALWLQVQSAAQAARKPLVIMPFGDSITEGANAVHNHANYRVPLFQKLSLAGYNVKSVGFHNRTSTGRDQFHPYNPAGQIVTDEDWELHSGVGSERLGAQRAACGSFYDSWANALDQAGDPDVVLMHCGINDMLNNNRNLGPAEAYVYMTNIVQKVMDARPNTKFVITSPMCCEYGHSEQNANKDTNKNFVQPLNALIVAFFNGVQAGTIEGFDKTRLYYADVYNNIMPGWYADDPQLDLNMKGSDHCHPSWIGHDIMAKTWFDQIVAAFPQDKDGNYDCRLAEIETPAAVDAKKLGAEAKEELDDFRKGFKKVRVLNPTGKEKFTKGEAPTYDWSDTTITDDAEIEKVGYFVEYVFPSATTNIHRWVWVDMDAFGDNTVAAVGLPTMGKTQQAVTSLHICGNHPGVCNTTADAEGIEGYLDFAPYAYGTGAARGAGAPARWMNICWDDAFDETGVYGAMQVHRKFAENEELGNRRAQVVFAYNGWSREDTALNNDFGIGNFGQHFNGVSEDWTYMGQTATMNASVLESKTIEIWVKLPSQCAAKIGDVEYDTLEEAIAALKNGATLTLQSDIELTSTLAIPGGTYGTIDLNGHTITSSGEGVALDFAAGSEVTVTGEGSISTKDGPAITSAGLTTISGTKGIPVIGGAKVTKGSASKLSVDEAFLPETPLVVDYDWSGTFMNSTMPRLAIAHTSDASYATRAKYNFNPIREVGGVVYAATMSGGADTNPGSNLHIFMVDYCYTVNEATIEIEHATIPYVFGVQTDTSTGKMYTLKQKVMISMGSPQYTTVTPEDISFTLNVESGYQNPTVVANGETIEVNEKGYYHIRPGATGTAISITAKKIPTTPTYDDVTEVTPLADIVPAEQAEILEKAGVTADKVAEWAKEKGGQSGSATIGGAINLEAFAFNCSPEELETTEKNFKASIEIAADGTIIVSAPEGYNITPVIKGSDDLKTWHDKADGDKFFKAVIDL